ncbi:aminotransferase [Metarhizobium album]|uniref:Aminotransferase n=1 Tax=Metarhizobium album TaxID=2182425 RepID=A0A2U2DRF7_9HYPH|nr:alanine--glyoxylate aminotransferase family protein [Rhizobium album]PWE55900.1 aminotransferase [Rhizobium album]
MSKPTQTDPIFTLTTGPVDSYPAVLRALARPVLYDYDPAFLEHYENVSRKVQKAFASRTMPVILQGEPVLGLEAAAASLLAREDVVLNLASGVYGAGFAGWAKRYCAEVVEIRVPYNEVIDPQSVADMLKARPEIRVVAVCHHDTPSGTINPVAEIGRIVHAHGALLLVDAVSSFGGMEVYPDTIHADLFVTGPNKCLGCPPGLSLLSVSDAAWAKMKANPAAPRASMLSILDWEDAWRADRPFPFTPSVAEINGLDAALDLYLDEGPENVWRRHALTAEATRAGILAAGLKLWPASEAISSPTTTAVRVPEGIDEAVLRKEARRRYGVVFSSGRGETLGKLTRIGHMGPTARPIYAPIAITALVGTLSAMGVAGLDLGAGVTAAMAVIDRDL